jgi:two-component system cell cycle sensor histidine kinase/response regulator CckA
VPKAVPVSARVWAGANTGGANLASANLASANLASANLGGVGLGLSAVLGIVRQSGGFLDVQSQIGVGTRVVVYPPRHETKEHAVAPTSPAPPLPVPTPPAQPRAAAGGGRVALVVEDEAPVRLVLARALTRAGWRVLAAETAEAALEMLGSLDGSPESQLSVVVSDAVMPGMDGPALVRAMRQICPVVPAVLVSGYAKPMLLRDLAAADIGFLPKPYATSELQDLAARLTGAKVRTFRDKAQG